MYCHFCRYRLATRRLLYENRASHLVEPFSGFSEWIEVPQKGEVDGDGPLTVRLTAISKSDEVEVELKAIDRAGNVQQVRH